MVGDGGGGHLSAYFHGLQKNLTEKVTVESKLQSGKEASLVATWKRSVPGRGNRLLEGCT